MAPIRIRKHVVSETLHLPELKPLIGKDVEILVREEKVGANGRRDLALLFDLAGNIDLDDAACQDLRRISSSTRLS
jgi:hypothetical protein